MQAWIAAAAVDAPRSYFWTSVKIQGKKIEVDPLNGIVLLTRRVAYIIFGHALYTINIYIYIYYMKYVCITFYCLLSLTFVRNWRVAAIAAAAAIMYIVRPVLNISY